MLETLGLLPDPGWRLRSFVESCALNVAIAVLLFCFALARLHRASPSPRYQSTLLTFQRKPPQHTAMLRIKLLPPRLNAELPRRINTPQPSPPARVLLKSPPPILPPAPNRAVVAATADRSLPTIKRGNFGDPVGVVANPNASKLPTIAAVGSFNSNLGPTQGAASVHAGSGHVASAGFANNFTGGGSAAQQTILRKPSFTPPQVLAEPRPQYTQEARQLRIQGEITLQVCFGADGKVQVLRVVSGLGHGLEDAARLAAEQITFKPATLDGQPTDHTTLIHILFQLA